MKNVNILDKWDSTFEWKELIVFILDSIENRVFKNILFFKVLWNGRFSENWSQIQRGKWVKLAHREAAQGKAKVQFPEPFGLLASNIYLGKTRWFCCPPNRDSPERGTGYVQEISQLHNINKNAFYKYFIFFEHSKSSKAGQDQRREKKFCEHFSIKKPPSQREVK